MPSIHTRVRLRPIRYGFLLRPDKAQQATRAFQINTCLWGGKFNPLIPVLETVPTWWSRHPDKHDSITDITNGYLDYFEPDFIIEMEPGLSAGLGYAPERVIQAENILIKDGGSDRDGHGQDIFPLYRELYNREYKFARREPHNIIQPNVTDELLHPFLAAVFGSFPSESNYSHYARGFADAFAPIVTAINAEVYERLLREGCTTPLRLGHQGLEVSYNDLGTPTLFVFNASQPMDLIDYWNLRAIRQNLVPIPTQFLPNLSGWCKQFIIDNYRPLPGNTNGVMLEPTVLFSRSIPTEDLNALYTPNFLVEVNGANCRQDWYPPIWRKVPSYIFKEERPTLSALEKTFEERLDPESPEVKFDSLSPSFADTYGPEFRWANVVKIEDWSLRNQFATTFPTEYRDPKLPNFLIGDRPLIPTTEGLVYFPRWVNFQQRWDLLDCGAALRQWFKAQEIIATPSDAGRVTEQIVQTLGGFAGVSIIAHPGIISLLNRTANTASLSVQYQKFKNEVNLVKGDAFLPERIFNDLVALKAVELGLEVRCTKCSSWTWYSLKEVDYKLTCSLCRKRFDFPVTEPSQSKVSNWAYRPLGPFALKDYAKGGYSAALALRFFALIMSGPRRASTTWAAGHELILTTDKKLEADFILWHQLTEWIKNDEPTQLIIGEAKSFGRDTFTQDDVDKMKDIASALPGTIFVFATMRDSSEISSEELQRIRAFALWGRERQSIGKSSKAPVILLTGTELFCSYSIAQKWKEIGGAHAAAVESALIHTGNPKEFANLTQQVYLGLDSYEAWNRKKITEERQIDGMDAETCELRPSASA